MRYIVLLLCFLLVQCDSNHKVDKKAGWIEKSNYQTLYTFLKAETFIVESGNGVNYQFSALSHYSHREIIKLMDQFETFPEIDKSLIPSLKIAGLNLNNVAEKDSFLMAKILNNDKLGAKEMLFISNYLKLQPANPYFIEAFRSITLKADKNFLKRFLVKSGYLKFNRFSDEYTTYDPNSLSHLPKGLVDTLLMKVFPKTK